MLWLCIRLPLLPHEALAASRAAQRQPQAERAALERLAWWALQWSSQVSMRCTDHQGSGDDAALWLEIGASEALFGSPATLRETVRRALLPLGYTARLAVAPTPQGALLLTRTQFPATPRTLDELRQQLEPLPLTMLALPAATIAALHAAGLRRIGELPALSYAALARRFGPDTSRYLQQLWGSEPEPLPMVLPPSYRSRCGFDGE
jgi:protein ImuB